MELQIDSFVQNLVFIWQQSGWLTPKLNQTVDPTELSTHYREKRISKETRKEILLLFTLFKLKLVVADFSYYFQAFENNSSGISYYLWVLGLAKTTVPIYIWRKCITVHCMFLTNRKIIRKSVKKGSIEALSIRWLLDFLLNTSRKIKNTFRKIAPKTCT